MFLISKLMSRKWYMGAVAVKLGIIVAGMWLLQQRKRSSLLFSYAESLTDVKTKSDTTPRVIYSQKQTNIS